MKLGALGLLLVLAGTGISQNTRPSPGTTSTCRGESTDPAGCVTAPRALYSPNPEYDEESRKAKIEGTVRIRIIVTKDGLVKHPEIVNSLAEALDKRAIESVSQWKFAPATRDGKPVATQIEVECTFKLK